MARLSSFLLTAVFATAMCGHLLGAESQSTAQPAAATSTDANGAAGKSERVTLTPVPPQEMNALSPTQTGLVPDRVTGLSIVRPAGDADGTAAASVATQNRVLPLNADNVAAFSRETAYSANWLVDGMRRLERDEKGQSGAQDNFDERDQSLASDTKTNAGSNAANPSGSSSSNNTNTAATDPLVLYLQKWITTPEAAAAAAATISSFNNTNNTRGDSALPALPSTSTSSGDPATSGNPSGGVPVNNATTSRNANNASLVALLSQSTLDTPGATTVLPPPPMPANAASGNSLLPPDQANAPIVGEPANRELKIKPATPTSDPTKPIINDKKYFPQLQRF